MVADGFLLTGKVVVVDELLIANIPAVCSYQVPTSYTAQLVCRGFLRRLVF